MASLEDITDKNLYAYCDNNPITRSDDGGEIWHIVVGAIAGASLNGVAKIATNLAEGKSWHDGLGVSMLAGAASGALAATGFGVGVMVAGNAAISMAESAAEQLIENGGFDNFSVGEMLFDGVVGGIMGAIGGKGKGSKHLTKLGIQSIKRSGKAFAHKGFKTGLKETGKAASYYFKSTKSYYKNFAKNLWKDATLTLGSSIITSDSMKYQYLKAFGR